jgi:hypothetical protein
VPSTTTTSVPSTTTTSVPSTTSTTIGSPPPGLSLDELVSADPGPADDLVAPGLSTSGRGELLVAFLSSNGPRVPSSQSFTRVSGGDLTWSRVAQSNARYGDAEIWTAVSPLPVRDLTVTATRSAGGYDGSITVAAFRGASSAVGAVAAGAAPSGHPEVWLTTTASRSWVWAVGHQWNHAVPPALGGGQTLVHQDMDPGSGSSWVQRQTSQSTGSGSTVLMSNTAPTTDQWDFAAVEIPSA